MLLRLRQAILVLLAVVIGYFLGGGPFADWTNDLTNMIRMSWSQERAARGSSSTLPILVSGFLLGQGLFLLTRQLLARIGPARARRIENLATWDPAVQLGTRFGLHQYLERCTVWASEDPTARTQTLALFKIRGLGKLNENRGTLATTQLLQRIAVELRAASLPESVSPTKRFLAHHFPRPLALGRVDLPAPRYPARWSGATFALAFRELDALQAATIARNVAEWIRHELMTLQDDGTLSLTVAIAVGGASSSGRGLASVAAQGLAETRNRTVTVILERGDMRREAVAQLNGVHVEPADIPKATGDLFAATAKPRRERVVDWLRSWAVASGCVLGALALLGLTSGTAPPSNSFPWPSDLKEMQLVDAAGTRIVRVKRDAFAPQAEANWTISDVVVAQGNMDDGPYNPFQVHVTATNTSRHTYYLSPFDFSAIDAAGRQIDIDSFRTLRLDRGLSGCWLKPGQSWSGWLVGARGPAVIKGLRFEPDRSTRIVLANPVPVELSPRGI